MAEFTYSHLECCSPEDKIFPRQSGESLEAKLRPQPDAKPLAPNPTSPLMQSLAKRQNVLVPCLRYVAFSTASPKRRPKSPPMVLRKPETKSEWWIVDGEMHEIGDNVPLRERFVIPRDNIPNRRRKQLREQFMRRTRLVLKESEHEPWCKKYLELYNELRENWERLYWDEGYSKKIAQDHANYESAEDDDQDFSPYRSHRSYADQFKEHGFVRNQHGADNRERVNLIRDKFEYDREQRMREKAFAPMNGPVSPESRGSKPWNQPFDARRYFSENESD
ncbi:hypothetical protein SAY87_000876 [Trapa incisa]|uniref:Uncharacterized protein n=1 Tax=Trapa incisa TaxID=236973 RepID=A0AAN7GHN0_9MYRT|nr:hypothetical protein SAY87_000876 [Trapa incisa]